MMIWLLLLLFLGTVLCHEDVVDMNWELLGIRIPIPMSDMTATYVPVVRDVDTGDVIGYFESDFILLAGGCIDGNYKVDDTTYFACNQISDRVFAFDPTSTTFMEMSNMPRKRYRHAAAVVYNKLYLVGGRALDDSDIPEIDVLDLKSMTWSTLMTLDSEYMTTDNGAVGYGNYLYVFGGFQTADYVALNSTIRIDVTVEEDVLKVERIADMITARGDIQTVIYNNDQEGRQVVFVVGGFTDTNGFCDALDIVEMYDLEKDQWSTLPSLHYEGGDKALVVLNQRVLSMGGEDKNDAFCSGGGDDSDPASKSIALDVVEVYDPRDTDNLHWHDGSNLGNERFRFAAAPWDATDTVYVFGGQMSYNETCQCFKCSDTVFSYRDVQKSDNNTKDSSSSYFTLHHTTLLTFLFFSILHII